MIAASAVRARGSSPTGRGRLVWPAPGYGGYRFVERGVVYDTARMEPAYRYAVDVLGMPGEAALLVGDTASSGRRVFLLVTRYERPRGVAGILWRMRTSASRRELASTLEDMGVADCEPLDPASARELLEARAADDPEAMAALSRLGWAPEELAAGDGADAPDEPEEAGADA